MQASVEGFRGRVCRTYDSAVTYRLNVRGINPFEALLACPALERVMNFGQALLAPVAEGEVAVWKGLEHRWVLRAGCG